jgi:hypothetical protein
MELKPNPEETNLQGCFFTVSSEVLAMSNPHSVLTPTLDTWEENDMLASKEVIDQ